MEGDIELPYICVYIGIYSSVYMRIYRYVYRYYGSFNRTVEGDIELLDIYVYIGIYTGTMGPLIGLLKAILSFLLLTLTRLSQ